MSRRVHVTIPKEVESLLEWYLREDPRFKNNPAAAVAHFFVKGIRAAYEQGLADALGLDADDFTVLADHQRRAVGESE
jgi:hypothetical protein